MADEIVADDSHCNNIATDCPLEATQEAAAPKGQIVHRFVNNFHIHQGGGDGVKCGNCGAEKSCPHCNAAVGKHQCEVCGMWISGHGIADHARVHTGERPHLCDRCGMAFKQSSHLSEHRRIHTGARPFVCDVCGQSFTQHTSLVYHNQSIHSNDRNHICQQCSKAFKLRKSLMRHLREVHKCVYDCGECGEKLRTLNEFTNHHAQHVKDRGTRESEERDDDVVLATNGKEGAAEGHGITPVTYDSQLT